MQRLIAKVISDNSYQGLRDLWGNQGQFVHGFEIGTDLQYYLTLNPTSKDYQPMGVYLPAEYQKGKMALLKQAPWFMFTCVPQAPQGIQIEDLAVAVGWEGDLPGSLFTALFADKRLWSWRLPLIVWFMCQITGVCKCLAKNRF